MLNVYQSHGTWSGSVSKVHITLQELQAVALVLYTMAYWLSGMVIAFI